MSREQRKTSVDGRPQSRAPARQRRKEKLMLSGIILLMVASMVAYGFYLKYFYFGKPRPSHKPASSNSKVLNE